MHLGFASQFGHTLAKRAPIGADCLPQGIVAVEDGSKPKRKYGSAAETEADHAGMFQDVALLQTGFVVAVVFADHYCEFSAGVAEHRGSVNSLNPLEKEGTSCSRTIGKAVLLSEAISVPRHIGLSEPGWRQDSRPQALLDFAKV
jgi:hypothetical protein